jgi:cytochrome c553
VTRNEIILGVVALVLVLFSLVVALVIPRRNPRFPGRYLRAFVLVSVLLVVAMLASVEVFGGEHEGEGGEATRTLPKGDAAAGEEVFTSAQPSCGNCHTLEAAGASQTLGPNLDEVLRGKDAAFIQESILDPDAEVAEGFPDNLMPEDYGEKLSDQELADLIAFLARSAGGSS